MSEQRLLSALTKAKAKGLSQVSTSLIRPELVKQLGASPSNFDIAACRRSSKASALHALKNNAHGALHILELDVADEARGVYPKLYIERRWRTVNVSSSLASIGLIKGSGIATHSISNAALNMLTYKQAKQGPISSRSSSITGQLRSITIEFAL
ncbi:hypothetical protein AcV7_002404 [Taiwanofungus camphoratus]|nr:hypothetical protein AcV7_002404 [Antrodia cinnamomea]